MADFRSVEGWLWKRCSFRGDGTVRVFGVPLVAAGMSGRFCRTVFFPFRKATLGARVLDRPGEGNEAISSRNSCCIRSSGLQAARSKHTVIKKESARTSFLFALSTRLCFFLKRIWWFKPCLILRNLAQKSPLNRGSREPGLVARPHPPTSGAGCGRRLPRPWQTTCTS